MQDQPAHDSAVLDAIAVMLDAKEWDADTCSDIAEALRLTGRTVRDLSEGEES